MPKKNPKHREMVVDCPLVITSKVQRNPRKRTVANPTAPQEKSLKSPSTSSTLKAASKLKKKSRVETLCEKKASQRKL